MSSPQKVVIPKGLINPRETTIVEIPHNLQNVGTVVAMAKSSTPHGRGGSPVRKTSSKITRKVLHKTHPQPTSGNTSWAYEGGVSFGGMPYQESSSMSSHGTTPTHSPLPAKFRRDKRGDISSGSAPSYGSFDPSNASSAQGYSYGDESVLYRDFPQKLPGSPYPRSPSSPKPFHLSDPGNPPSPPSSGSPNNLTYYSVEYSETEPGHTSPSSYHKMEKTMELPEPGSGGSPFDNFNPPDSATMYWEAGEVAPGLRGQQPSPTDPSGSSPRGGASGQRGFSVLEESGGTSKLDQSDLMKSLGQLESKELQKIMGDLSSFQSTRRRLVFDTSSLASASQVSDEIMQQTI